MTYEPEIIFKRDHLLVVSRGEFDLDAGSRLFSDLLREARATGLSRILVDNRLLASPLAATEKAVLGVSLEGAYLDYLSQGGPSLRVAFLVLENWLFPYRPLADHLNSIGLEAETFSDPEAMNEWLGVSQA
jgi:hypothetical protein